MCLWDPSFAVSDISRQPNSWSSVLFYHVLKYKRGSQFTIQNSGKLNTKPCNVQQKIRALERRVGT